MTLYKCIHLDVVFCIL